MNDRKYAVFTMDVESFADTECISASGIRADVDVMDGLDEYMAILDRHNIKSTLFTVGDLAPQIADRLRSHVKNGHTLALHSYSHIAPVSVPLEKFREQTCRVKDWMQKRFGVEVMGFRAPCFSMDKQHLEVLEELGFRYDSSHLDYTLARHTVKLDLQSFRKLRHGMFRKDGFYEFGLAKEKVMGKFLPISGGGYVRLSHWGFMKTLISHYIHQNDYYVFYLHPFELTKQKVPIFKELKSYDRYYLKMGICTYHKRIEQIINMLKKSGYEFVTFEQLVRILDRES